MGYFQVHIDEIELNFFMKLWWQKKIILPQMYRIISQNV